MKGHSIDLHRHVTLHQNRPDPFGTVTVIPFSLHTSGTVSIVVADLYGRELLTLLHEWRPAGDHAVEFNGEGYPEGLYLYRISVDEVVHSKTMLLLRAGDAGGTL